MAVLSGKFGVVNGYSHIKNWNLERTSAPEIYRTSATEFGQFAGDGVTDWSGGFEGVGEGPPTTLFPGSVFTFQGYTAPTTGIYGNDGVKVTGSAIVDSLTIDWTWGEGASQGWSIEFSAASGVITEESDGIFADTSVVIPDKMCNLVLQTGASGAEAAWLDLTSASLSISADNQSFVNSGTACTTHRTKGPIDWSLSVTEQSTAMKFALGSDTRFRIYTDAADFWLLEWGHLQDIGGLTIDIESGAIIDKTYSFIMQGSYGGSIGSLTHPDGTEMWPESSVAT